VPYAFQFNLFFVPFVVSLHSHPAAFLRGILAEYKAASRRQPE
jgi:hypothetical protein